MTRGPKMPEEERTGRQAVKTNRTRFVVVVVVVSAVTHQLARL